MDVSPTNGNVRHDRGVAADHLGHEPLSPRGLHAARDDARRRAGHVRACTANGMRFGRRRARDARRGAWGVAASIGGRRPIRGFQTKDPRRISPRGPCSPCDDDTPVIGRSNTRHQAVRQTTKFSATASIGRGPSCSTLVRNEKARRRFWRGLYEFCDDDNMHLICPTRQVPKKQIQTGAVMTLKRSPRRGWHDPSQNALARSGRVLANFRNDVLMPVICPTCQTPSSTVAVAPG